MTDLPTIWFRQIRARLVGEAISSAVDRYMCALRSLSDECSPALVARVKPRVSSLASNVA
eukprot:4929833-Pyramimonas_sp.AAC.1